MAACYITVHWQCPAGVFGEYRLQKNGESQREILKMHDFSASRSEP